ncbi:MAG: hypothetical protein HN578_10585 [Rhodospirillales bacterium]|jgi:endonuclease/exonuclease/phosphatase (EEP) superfamily protein YafD|nr:hypothetical protein [Rhodospirillales bacterium]
MKILGHSILITGIVLCAISAGASLPTYHLIIDLLSHFRFQYFCAAILGFLICLLLGRQGIRTNGAAGLYLIATVLNGWVLLPYVPNANAHANTGGSLKVALANVRTSNRNHNAVLSVVRDQNPDLVVLIETNDRWVKAMGPLTEDYPHISEIFRPLNFGMTILSKVPLEEIETRYFTENEEIPSLLFKITLKGQKYRIVAVHATPPIGANVFGQDFDKKENHISKAIRNRTLQLRNEHLRAITDWVSIKSDPTLIVGDLNTTPFSHAFKQFLSVSKLRDTRKGQGFLPTWGPLSAWPFRLPIDHFLSSQDLEVTSLTVGPDIGSDHRPLIAVIKPVNNALVLKRTD